MDCAGGEASTRDSDLAMKIACIHQGYELYGSDRCFAESVAALREAYPAAEIEVVLPRPGPIVAALVPHASRISFEPLFVLRRRTLARLALTGWFALPLALARAARRFAGADLVYINTSVVLDYQLVARAFPGKALLHIHEIPTGFARKVLRAAAMWSGARLVFNSRATRDSFSPPPGRAGEVIYNGLDGPLEAEPATYEGQRPLRVALIGRINRIKGQDVLLAALKRLPAEVSARIETRMVGGAFENPALEARLRDDVAAAGLSGRVSVEPFVADTAPIYAWADVVVAPSKLPESLGRTAIEAMSFGRPALVSAIGGLTEVVADGETGWHAPPGDAVALAAALEAIVVRPEAWRDFPAQARARYAALFSRSAASAALAAAAARTLARTPAAGRAALAAKTR
jgi:glycosyltransferase involved in cell wall biosynthesis